MRGNFNSMQEDSLKFVGKGRNMAFSLVFKPREFVLDDAEPLPDWLFNRIRI